MNKIDKNEVHMILTKTMWDYDIDPGEIYDLYPVRETNFTILQTVSRLTILIHITIFHFYFNL